MRADELDPEIQQRVLALAGLDEGEIALHVPYLDRREWPKRGRILASLRLERNGDVISFVPPPAGAIRDAAATLAMTDPAWIGAPPPNHPDHFALWQNVSMTLQSSLRAWIAEQYFRDIARFEDRNEAYSMLVYQAARVCHGRSRGEFTYAFHDYPACRQTLALALKMTGRNLQTILAGAELRLKQAGKAELARRYAPVWYQDIVVAVRQKPKLFLALLGSESVFINALVDLSVDRTPAGVHSFSRAANRALRRVYGTGVHGTEAKAMDLRLLGVRALELATEVLSEHRMLRMAARNGAVTPPSADPPPRPVLAGDFQAD
jgi:hypothetical protein